MKRAINLLICFCTGMPAFAQNIGINTENVTRARLEVTGVAGSGRTTALFGDDRGITVHQNNPGIGMNMYWDNSSYGRYMAQGTAAVWRLLHNEPNLGQALSLTTFPSGVANAALPAGTRAWHFSNNNRFQINYIPPALDGSAMLDVGRGTGGDGTAMFSGTAINSHFNYGSEEHTYIRAGKSSGHVYLNDILNGKVIIGNGSSTFGINTNYNIPSKTLEVRQSNGGIEITNSSYTNMPWELRVAAVSPADLELYYQGVRKAYFKYDNGALYTTSDARIKSNIAPLPQLLNKLMLLQPVSYFMKTDKPTQTRSMGFIAQQVQRLFPEIISPNMGDDGKLLGISYDGFGVLAIKGIQEEQAQIIQLDKSLQEMEARLSVLENKLKKKE